LENQLNSPIRSVARIDLAALRTVFISMFMLRLLVIMSISLWKRRYDQERKRS
jgi:hypothetical protein